MRYLGLDCIEPKILSTSLKQYWIKQKFEEKKNQLKYIQSTTPRKLNIQEKISIHEHELGALSLGESVEIDGIFDGSSLELTMLLLLFRN